MGEIVYPAFGLSTVMPPAAAPLADGDTLLFRDSESGFVLTAVRGTTGGNVVDTYPSPGAPGDVVISPAALGASVDDYNPANLANATHMRLTAAGGGSTLNSMVSAGLVRSTKKIINVSADVLTIPDSTVGTGVAANKFLLPPTLPGFPNVAMNPGDSADFWYDPVTTLWRLV